MIEIIISGEGNSDVGKKDYLTNQFIPGPITILTDKIIRFFDKDDVNYQFKSRLELKRYPMTLKGKKKRFKNAATGKGHSDLAYKLGCLAKENKAHVAVLMRDARKNQFLSVYNEIKSGFIAATFENGVPAVPVPESEAWLVCCLEPKESGQIENCKTDMKKLLENKLIKRRLPHTNDRWRDIADNCMIELIEAPSFKQYKNDLEQKMNYPAASGRGIKR